MIGWWRHRFRRMERLWIERRVDQILPVIQQVVGNQPFVRSGRWSWTDPSRPLEVHLLFPYVPVAYQCLSWYDVDRRLCQWTTGDYEHRRRQLSVLTSRAERLRLPLVLVPPDQWLDEDWIRQRLPKEWEVER